MKRKKLLLIVTLCIILNFSPTVLCSQLILDRPSFHAEIGIGGRDEAQFELDGNPMGIRDRNIVSGTATFIGTERTFRFQGMFTKNIFFIQSGISDRILNIAGSFNRHDEETQTFYGYWFGFIMGYGFTRGWIEARLV